MKKLSLITLSILISTSLLGMSKTPKKLISSGNTKNHKFKASGKSMGDLQASITKFDNGNGDITFKAQILPRKDMINSEYKWELPKTAKLISGSLDGHIDYKKNQVKTIELIIDKESLSDNDKIFFFAFKMIKGERHGASVTYIIKSSENSDEAMSQKKSRTKKKPKFFQ